MTTITNSEFRKLMIDKLKTINGAFEKKIAPLIEGMDDNLLDHSTGLDISGFKHPTKFSTGIGLSMFCIFLLKISLQILSGFGWRMLTANCPGAGNWMFSTFITSYAFTTVALLWASISRSSFN